MIDCFLLKNGSVRQIEPSGLGQALLDPEVVAWVDLEAPTVDEGEFLRQTFGLHPLAIEDCLSPKRLSPKLDDYGSYLFVVVHGIDHNLPPGVLDTLEFDMFMGTNFIATSHLKPSISISNTKRECLQQPSIMASPDILAHRIIDGQVDDMFPPVEEEMERLAQLKREILLGPQPYHLEAILEMEEGLLNLDRILEPELSVLQAIARRGEPFLRASTIAYFRDIQDHLGRLREMVDMVGNMTERNLSVYLSVTANRTSDFTKALSLAAMMFLPLTLIVGIYGMNFKNMPETEWKYGYFIVLAVVLLLGAGLAVFYRKKRWI
ncbi:MAG: magnesium transporter CorA family protein [Chloroflexota bacterium]